MVTVDGAEDPNKLEDADEAGVPNGLAVDDWELNMEDDGVDDDPNGEEDTDDVIDDPNNEVQDDGV